MRRIDYWMRPEGITALLIAIATTFVLQSTRVFVSYLVFVVDQSQRVTIALIAIVAFTFPIVTAGLARFRGRDRLFAGAIGLLIVSRLVVQVIEHPAVRLASSGLVIVAWGVLFVLVAASQRRSAAFGLLLGFGLDLALRTARGPLDLPWMPGLVQTLGVVVLAVLLAFLGWTRRPALDDFARSWRGSAALVVVGPAIALFYLITGNPAFVAVQTGLSATASSALLAAGLILGTFIAVLRLLALGMGAGGVPMAGRFILFDAIIGGIALSFAWGGDGMALLGIFFVAVTVTELLLFALATEPATGTGSLLPVSVMTTLGFIVQFAVLFLYYTSTGSGLMLAIAWIGLIVGTVATLIPLSSALQRCAFKISAYAAPAIAIVLLLGGALLWSLADRSTPELDPLQSGSVSVITYNIQSGFSRDNYWDLEATAAVIEDAGADVVILQEVSRGWLVTTGNDELAWLSQRLDMPYAWGPASTDDLWGNAILSRYPIVTSDTFKFGSTQNLKRSALVSELEINGQIIRVIATHLDNPSDASAARAEQVDQLADLIDLDRPTILAGDFNMSPDDPLIRGFIDAGLGDAAALGGAETPTSEDGVRIDYVFVSPDLEVTKAVVIESDASDHKPVTVTLELP